MARRVKLPGKIVFGLFLFCAALLLLDGISVVPLSLLPFGWALVVVATLLFVCLSLAAVGGEVYEDWSATPRREFCARSTVWLRERA